MQHLNGTRARIGVLQWADLSGAIMSGVDLSEASLAGANLSGAHAVGASFHGAFLGGAVMTGANLSGADVRNAVWHNNQGISSVISTGAVMSEREEAEWRQRTLVVGG